MEEEWRPIKGYEGLYEVSNMGRVKSLHSDKEIIISASNDSVGYKTVTLVKRTHKQVRVHRLVAGTFIPNPMNLSVVNHLDGDKKNNNVYNLEWCSAKENANHAIKTGLTNLTVAPKPVMAYKDDKLVGVFRSIRGCAEKLNCDKRHISDVIHGKLKTHHGFSFRLVNDKDLNRGDFRNLAIKVMAVKGAEIAKSKSCRELAKQLKVSDTSVSHALKTGVKLKGYIIKKED